MPIDPYFAKKVTRSALSRSRFATALFGFAQWRLLASSSVAALALAGLALLSPPTAALDVGGGAVANCAPSAIEHGLAAVGYVEYFDALVATSDPSLLSDQDILELIIDDGSSALLF